MEDEMNFTFQSHDKNATCSHSVREKDGVLYIDLKVSYAQPTVPSHTILNFSFPCKNIIGTWGPNLQHNRAILPSWAKSVSASRLTSGAPVHSLYSVGGKNSLTIAVSDAATPLDIRTGVQEKTAEIDCEIVFFTFRINAITEYKATVRLDTRGIDFCDAIENVANWWSEECGYASADVPEAARLPMNSAWYSFHQDITGDELVRQCELSKPLGMDTIIVDDGWQTDDNSLGYAYCGDWEIAASKIHDIHDLVDRIHNTGMKVMFWYSVPFIGKHTKSYEKFKDMVLGESYSPEWFVLDPRYPEVREYLIGKYRQAIENWGLDGLKLDFIDSFQLQPTTPVDDPRRDCESLEIGVERLLKQTMDTLTAIKPDILIEFRQKYMGPTIRKYSNMMRVGDCPNDSARNRVGVVDLRLTSGKTAVHSDMLMWNYDEPAEQAALQIVNILFGVPQISVLIDKLSEKHCNMLSFYLNYWREHRELLLDGKLSVKHPESNYSLVQSVKDSEIFAVAYADGMLKLDREYSKIIFVNACADDCLYITSVCEKAMPYRILDCCGREIACGEVKISQIPSKFSVPLSGIVEIG
jgi:alpha-galactosidase